MSEGKIKRHCEQLVSDAEERVDKRLKAMEEKVNRMEEFYLRAGSRALHEKKQTPPTPILKRSNAIIMPCPSTTSQKPSIPSTTLKRSESAGSAKSAESSIAFSLPSTPPDSEQQSVCGLLSLKDEDWDCLCNDGLKCPIH